MAGTTDVFGRSVALNGAFSADSALITFGTFGAGLLAQELSITYQQQVQRLYEIGSKNVYVVVGRPEGSGEISRVIGPVGLVQGFYSTYGNVCAMSQNDISLTFATGCGSSTGVGGIQLKNVLLTGFSMGVKADTMLIGEKLAIMFIGCAFI